MKCIEIKHVTKTFGHLKAVDDLSFSVEEGSFFSFLGINGAGKSTTISMLCGELSADEGEIDIEGKNIKEHLDEIKCSIGVVYQNSVLDEALTVYDNLKYRASLYHIPGKELKKRIRNLSHLLGFEEYLKKPLNQLSGGQKRRIDIARALIHEPRLLILDEPTTGLDPQTRKILWQVIHDIRLKKHLTVFLTTHYMEETVESDQIVIIHQGHLIASGTPYELKQKYAYDTLNIYHVQEEAIQKLGYSYQKIQEGYKIHITKPYEARNLIIKYPELFKDFELIKGGMDDVFLNVTGIKLPEGGNHETVL